MNIFQHFGVPVPDINQVNMISVDFGDGMLSANIAQYDSAEEKIACRPLYFDDAHQVMQYPAAVYMEEETPEKDLLLMHQNNPAAAFYNYKRCPQTPQAKVKYGFDDEVEVERAGETIRTRESRLNYEQVMARAFNAVMNHLFACNAQSEQSLLSRVKPTYIFVGRPSGTVWEKHDRYYAELLQSSLHIKGYDQPVYILIQAESTAALAIHTQGEQAITDDMYVLVLDLGSSTFDATLITPHGIPRGGEDSRQFGANLLDEVLVMMLLSRMKEGMRLAMPHGLKLRVRRKKEEYYGPDGYSENRTTIYEYVVGGDEEEIELKLNKKTMREALESDRWPVKYCTYMAHESGALIPQWRKQPWLAACKEIFADFRERMAAFLPEGKTGFDRVILTGGVAIMPEVIEAAQEIYGDVVTTSKDRCFAVSQGLAYMLYVEARKQELIDQFLGRKSVKRDRRGNEGNKLITVLRWIQDLSVSTPRHILMEDDRVAELRDGIVSGLCDELRSILTATIKKWGADTEDKRTIEEAFQEEWEKKQESVLRQVASDAVKVWKKDVDQEFESQLKRQVVELFPNVRRMLEPVKLTGYVENIADVDVRVFISLGLGKNLELALLYVLRPIVKGIAWLFGDEVCTRREVKANHVLDNVNRIIADNREAIEKKLSLPFMRDKIIASMLEQYEAAVPELVDMMTPYLMMTINDKQA